MASWSIPIQQQGWKLRVLSGTSIGKEFQLAPSRYVLGSRAPAHIVIPDPSIAPQHVVIDIHHDHVFITDCSNGPGMSVNGNRVGSFRLAPGDHVTVGTFKFEFSNPGYQPTVAAPHSLHSRLEKLSLTQRVGIITFGVAAALYLLLVTTEIPTLVPVTLIAMSVVVPATTICYLVERYDTTGISFHTLSLTFLAGGTIGIISAIVGFKLEEMVTGGFLLVAMFAGVVEEPAKLLATFWRWKHPAYDRPMDGLIIGTVSGLGFAVFETAGYGFNSLLSHGGLGGLLTTMLLRGITAPFGHGLWSGIVAAAFWQCGRDPRRAVRSPVFHKALLWAVGLHALWNMSAMKDGLGFGFVILSAYLSVRQYRMLLAAKGYRPG